MEHGRYLNRKQHWVRAAGTCGPAGLWLLLFLFAPLLGILGISLLSRGDYGDVQWPFTLENYKRLLGFGWLGFDPLYPLILGRSILLGATTATICALVSLPLVFFIARLRGRFRTAALVLVIVPFWTNLLIRTYAWQILLAPDSWISRIAQATHLIPAGEGLYPGTFAVAIGMVCDYLPFMALPLYTSVEKLDWSLSEAAMDLGADRWGVFRHALLPQIAPGLAAGLVLVFLPATGQFVIPDLLGGAKTVMLGNAIQQQFGQARDWPFGSAMASVTLALVLLGVLFRTRKARSGEVL